MISHSTFSLIFLSLYPLQEPVGKLLSHLSQVSREDSR